MRREAVNFAGDLRLMFAFCNGQRAVVLVNGREVFPSFVLFTTVSAVLVRIHDGVDFLQRLTGRKILVETDDGFYQRNVFSDFLVESNGHIEESASRSRVSRDVHSTDSSEGLFNVGGIC